MVINDKGHAMNGPLVFSMGDAPMKDTKDNHAYWQKVFTWFKQQETELCQLRARLNAAKANIAGGYSQKDR